MEESIRNKVYRNYYPVRVLGSLSHSLDIEQYEESKIATNVGIFVGNNSFIIPEAIAVTKNSRYIRQLIRKYFGFSSERQISVCFDLLYYINNTDPNFRTDLTPKEIAYISSLDNDALLSLLSEDYTGSNDRASLLYTLYTGLSTEVEEFSVILNDFGKLDKSDERDMDVDSYDPAAVFSLLKYSLQLMNKECLYEKYNIGPYAGLKLSKRRIVEDVISGVNLKNCEEVAENYGINIENAPRDFIRDLYVYVVQQLCFCDYIIMERTESQEEIEDPPTTIDPEYDFFDYCELWSHYTLDELIDFYQLDVNNFTGYEECFHHLYRGLTTPTWRINATKYCDNDDTINIMEGDLHGNVKYDEENPTFSYGTLTQYSCYQLDELEGSFREYDGVFKFRNPDWLDPRVGDPRIDPRTNEIVRQNFAPDVMRGLLNLLGYKINGEQKRITKNLRKIIKYGLERLEEDSLAAIKDDFDAFSEDEQFWTKVYILWLFTYGMWMRFWRGPGTPWANSRFDIHDKQSIKENYRCSPADRDQHSFIQQALYYHIIKKVSELGSGFAPWIDNLPKVTYHTGLQDVTVEQAPIKDAIMDTIIGNMCQGIAGDDFVATGYTLVVAILNSRNDDDFNLFVDEVLPHLISLEHEVVKTLILESPENPQEKEDIKRDKILKQRFKETKNTDINQPSFDSTSVMPNQHV